MQESTRQSHPPLVAIVGVSVHPGGCAGGESCGRPGAGGGGESAVPARETDLAVALAREALKDGGHGATGAWQQRAGVVLGHCDFYRTWSRRGTAGSESSAGDGAGPALGLPMLLHPVRSESPGSPSTRVAEALGLGGPSCTIDADETAPLVALDAAVKDLQEHRADLMLVGSVQVLAADEMVRVRPPGAGQGVAGGGDDALREAGGMLVLERLEDACERGHRIYAVVLATGRVVNPSLSGTTLRKKRLKALQALAENSGVDLRSVDVVEVHGSGILSEDADWWEALTIALGGRGEARGAFRCVEPPAGHSSPIAALSGMMRLIAALHQRVLPPATEGTGIPPSRTSGGASGSGSEPRAWPRPSDDSSRRALLIGQGCASTVQVIFEEAPQAVARPGVAEEDVAEEDVAEQHVAEHEVRDPRDAEVAQLPPPEVEAAHPPHARSADTRTMILCGHFALMNEFLSSQAAVFAHLAACPRSPAPDALPMTRGAGPVEGTRWPLLERDSS